MTRRTLISQALPGMGAVISAPGWRTLRSAESPQSCDHAQWVQGVLTKMLTIKPGMTRGDLKKVFEEEGGRSTVKERVYVSQDCPYFKARVQFAPVGRARLGADGQTRLDEDAQDVITGISTPFLQFRVLNEPDSPRA